MTGDDLRPAPLPNDRKSLEFFLTVLKHSITPSKINGLVTALRGMRFDVQTCLTDLEATFQDVRFLYDMMGHRLARVPSQTSLSSTSTNLPVRIKFVAWLTGWEGTWGPFRQRESTPVSQQVSSQTPFHLIIGFSFKTFLNHR